MTEGSVGSGSEKRSVADMKIKKLLDKKNSLQSGLGRATCFGDAKGQLVTKRHSLLIPTISSTNKINNSA